MRAPLYTTPSAITDAKITTSDVVMRKPRAIIRSKLSSIAARDDTLATRGIVAQPAKSAALGAALEPEIGAGGERPSPTRRSTRADVHVRVRRHQLVEGGDDDGATRDAPLEQLDLHACRPRARDACARATR